jgi:lipopolysaccharide export system permease protein
MSEFSKRQFVMLWPKILNRYIFSQIAISFLFSFAVFLIAGLIVGFLPLLQKVVEADLGLTLPLLQILINTLPSTLVTVVPLSIMIGTLLGLGRMSADNEIAAIKSAGISIVRLLPPVLLVGLIGWSLASLCTIWLIPKGISESRKLLETAAKTGIAASIEERTFFDSITNLIVYVDQKDPQTGILHGIFIQQKSQPDEIRTIIAQKGKISPDPEGKFLILDLRNGSMVQENQYGDFVRGATFESNTYRFPLERLQAEKPSKTMEEMSLKEIKDRIAEHTVKEAQADSKEFRDFYRRSVLMGKILSIQRLTHPLACLALALMAFPIGALNLGKSRLNNVSVGLAVIFIYYALTLTAERMARSAIAPPELALPMPPALFAVAAIYLINRVRLERISDPLIWARGLAARLSTLGRRKPA